MFEKKRAIVIGGGIGGLVSAISLAQRGIDVSLYEKNSQFGGKMQTFRHEGFQFDIGPSMITTPSILESLFKKSKLNMYDYIDFVELDHQSRTFFPDGTTLDLYNRLSQMRERNTHISDDDIRDYEDYLNDAKRIYGNMYEDYFENTADNWGSYKKLNSLFSLIRNRSSFSSMQDSINKFIKNKYLREVLSLSMNQSGSSVHHAPAIYNVMNYLHNQEGVWYIRDGAKNLAEGLVQLAADLGVDLNHDVEVTKINYENNELKHVELSSGQVAQADYYVCNTSPAEFYQLIDKPQINEDKNLPSTGPSAFIMFLGVSKVYDHLSHHNIYMSGDSAQYDKQLFTDKKCPTDPTVLVVNTSNLEKHQAKDGYTNLKIHTSIPNMTDVEYTKEDYVYLRHQVLNKLEKMGLSDLRKHIVFEQTMTPHDIYNQYKSRGGAMNGVSTDMRYNKGFKYPKKSDEFTNLYFVGASVHPSATPSMVALNAQQVGRMIRDDSRS